MPRLPRKVQVKRVHKIIKSVGSKHTAFKVLKRMKRLFKSGKLRPPAKPRKSPQDDLMKTINAIQKRNERLNKLRRRR